MDSFFSLTPKIISTLFYLQIRNLQFIAIQGETCPAFIFINIWTLTWSMVLNYTVPPSQGSVKITVNLLELYLMDTCSES